MGKLIDLTARLNNKKDSKIAGMKKKAEVFDLVEPRQAILQDERRELRRTILTEFVGAFVVVPERGLLRVSLYDISDDGLAFEMDLEQGSYQEHERVAMRIYLNHKTYFEFVVQVKWRELQEQQGIIRHGTMFVKNTVNDVALKHFVKFIEAVSVNLRADDGDLQISNGS
ncbi:MAG: PilZ domain-containing protein [Bdellovibrionaceae bacterium]|nr:PilZ domain-containing protein [Pseudobdellovibrionaceae bacterium]MBX3034826.1 PilZ domain-containing protein [Pseudobdellovibrionaceae bacterium]